MVKFFTRSAILLAVILAAGFQYVSATHIRGSDISYRCLGGNQYQIVVTVYRDCSGVAVPTSITVDVSSNCGTSTVTATQDPLTSNIEVSQLCPTATSTCQGGSFPGVRMYTYVGTVIIQPNCGVYTFSYDDCCRNTVTNLVDPSPPSLGFSVEATLNSNAVNCDFAPSFTSLPVPYFCVNQLVNYSHGALDVDGDSLSYTLIAPLNDLGNPLTYTGGYSPSNPMPTASGFVFDSLTGQMTFTPTQQGVYSVAVLVREYRNGVLIGTTMRDIQIVIINCSNNAPQVNNCLSVSNVTGAQVIDCNSLGVCPGQNVSFTITGRDPDGQLLTVTSNIAASIPGATLTTTNVRPDSVVVVFNWTPSANDTGFRYFTVQFRDNACPIAGNQLFTYDITVLDGIYAGPDLYYCTGGGPVQVNVFGGTQFSWSNTNGMVSANPDSSVVLLAPSSNQTYYIQSDLMGGCKTLDTLNVFNVTTFSTNITSPDDTICLNSSTTLTVTPTPSNQGPFTYSWAPLSQGVISPTLQTTEVRPRNTTMYHVTVVSSSGCTVRDSFRVVLQGVGPKVTVRPSADYVCPGSNVTLNTTVSALECGPVSDPLNPCLPNSNFALQTVGTGTANASANTTPYIGFWMDGRVQYLYRASELQALGLAAGTITDLAFNVSTKLSTAPYNNYTIKMACTSLTQLPTTFVTAGFTTVLNPQSYTTSVGWNTHTFDVPYNWDGFSNLIIEICFDNSAYTQYDNVLYTATTFPGSVLWDNADLGSQSGCTALTTPTLGQNRPNTRFIMCTAPLTNYTFNWTPSLPDTSAPVVQVNANTTYQVIVDDGTCQGDTTVTVNVDSAVLISAGPDFAICSADSAQLNAQLLYPAVPYCIPSYSVSNITYSPRTPTSGTFPGPTGDDVVSAAIPVPFPFQFYCNTVSNFYISTNGFITFSPNQGSGCCAGQSLPNAAIPNNLIALCWEDLNTTSGGTIDFFVAGTAPNRVGVVRWNNVAYYSVGGFVNGQIQVYETSNVIEVHLGAVTTPNQTNTMGIENATGTAPAYSPVGYNASGWTVSSPVAYRFTPQSAGNALTNVVWTPANGLSNDTILNPKASPGANTTYVVNATFTNGCVTRDTVEVRLGSFPYTLSAVPDSICSGDSAQLNFIGNGVAYSWTPSGDLSDDSIANPFASPASTTTYTVIASDSIGCRVQDTVTVIVRTHPFITLGSDSSTCPTDSLTLIPSGGPYTSYLWSTGETTPSITTANQITNPQEYFVRVNDGTCFYLSDTVQISEFTLNPIVVQPAGDTAVCIGDSIVLRADAGYQSYQWTNGASTQSITVSLGGSYSYFVIDSNGCVIVAQDTANVSIEQRPVASIITTDDTICDGQSTAILSVNPATGIVYIWNPGGTVADSLEVSGAGRYYLVASNNGCNSFDSIDIQSTVPPLIDLGENQSFCGCDTAITLSSTPPVSGNYNWSTTESTSAISVSSTGSYSLTVSDANECTATDAVDITIRCLTVDAVVADPSTGTVFIGRNATLDVDSFSYTSDFAYVWTPSIYLDDTTVKSPYVSAPQNTTTYTVMVTDIVYGCVAYDSVRLAVVPPGVPPMPNAFSPNGDGQNDTYGPYIPPSMQGIYVVSQMRIYNRWGQMVYNGTANWDGVFNGALQPANTYVYYITIEGPDQNNPNINIGYNLTGSFTLLH